MQSPQRGKQLASVLHKNGTHQAGVDSGLVYGHSAANASLPEPAMDRPAIWTSTSPLGSMWPTQLLDKAADLGAPANLIQWTLLIGSLLSLVLLIMLIVRKLFVSTFPSYRWLLAKQTAIKPLQAGSIRGRLVQSNKECRCRHQPQHRHQSLAGLAGTQLLCDDASRIVQHHHQVGSISHQMCQPAEWRPLEGSAQMAAKSGKLASAAYQQYLLTEASGRHLLSDEFKADYADLTGQPRQPSSTATHSSRGSAGRTGLRYCQEDQGFALMPGYNYEPLDEGAYCYQGDAEQRLPDDKGFVLTRDFVAQSCASGQLGGAEDTGRSINYTSTSNSREARNKPAKQNSMESRHNKLVKSGSRDDGARQDEPADRNAQSHSGSSSITSSVAGESTASNSVQSTTAPMLSSNAGSFEQPSPNELASSEFNTPGSSVLLISNPLSAGCSPASVSVCGGKPRHNNSINLAGTCPQGAQSQPCSPMILNSFKPNQPLSRCRAPKLSVRVRPVRDQDEEANDDSGYAQPEQSGPISVKSARREPPSDGMSAQRANSRPDQSVLELARTFEAKRDCDIDERHYYEEISSQRR